MKELYKELSQAFADKKFRMWNRKNGMTFNEFSHFVSMKGKYYSDDLQCRLFIVGRATNG